jgi:hypothetical protein
MANKYYWSSFLKHVPQVNTRNQKLSLIKIESDLLWLIPLQLQILQHVYGVLKYATLAAIAEEMYDICVIFISHDPDIW